MEERRKQKRGSCKENGRKHRFVEQLAALVLCAALLVSNTLISRADDDAVVMLPVVEGTGEQQDADTGAVHELRPCKIKQDPGNIIFCHEQIRLIFQVPAVVVVQLPGQMDHQGPALGLINK